MFFKSIAKKTPLRICIIKQRANNDPKFHKYDYTHLQNCHYFLLFI